MGERERICLKLGKNPNWTDEKEKSDTVERKGAQKMPMGTIEEQNVCWESKDLF